MWHWIQIQIYNISNLHYKMKSGVNIYNQNFFFFFFFEKEKPKLFFSFGQQVIIDSKFKLKKKNYCLKVILFAVKEKRDNESHETLF